MKVRRKYQQSVTITRIGSAPQVITVTHDQAITPPMSQSARRAAYSAQNPGRKFTVRQLRAIRKAGVRAACISA